MIMIFFININSTVNNNKLIINKYIKKNKK